MVIVASGANHGFWRTLPFVSGATVGFTLLLVLVGFWLARAIDSQPALFRWLGIAGALFIAWIGWRIATARPELDHPLLVQLQHRPCRLQQARTIAGERELAGVAVEQRRAQALLQAR